MDVPSIGARVVTPSISEEARKWIVSLLGWGLFSSGQGSVAILSAAEIASAEIARRLTLGNALGSQLSDTITRRDARRKGHWLPPPSMPKQLHSLFGARLAEGARGSRLYSRARKLLLNGLNSCSTDEMRRQELLSAATDPKPMLLVAEILQGMVLEEVSHDVLLAAGMLVQVGIASNQSDLQPNPSATSRVGGVGRSRSGFRFGAGHVGRGELLTVVRDALRREAEGACAACGDQYSPAGPVMQTFTMHYHPLPADAASSNSGVQVVLSRAAGIIRKLLVGHECKAPYTSRLQKRSEAPIRSGVGSSIDTSGTLEHPHCRLLPALLALAQPQESHAHIQFHYRTARLTPCEQNRDKNALDEFFGKDSPRSSVMVEERLDSPDSPGLCLPASGLDPLHSQLLISPNGTGHVEDLAGMNADAEVFCRRRQEAMSHWNARQAAADASRRALACVGHASASVEKATSFESIRSATGNIASAIDDCLTDLVAELPDAIASASKSGAHERLGKDGQMKCMGNVVAEAISSFPLEHDGSDRLARRFQPGTGYGVSTDALIALSTPRWTPPMSDVSQFGLEWTLPPEGLPHSNFDSFDALKGNMGDTIADLVLVEPVGFLAGGDTMTQSTDLAFAASSTVASTQRGQIRGQNDRMIERRGCGVSDSVPVSVELLVLSFDFMQRIRYVEQMLRDIVRTSSEIYNESCIRWNIRFRVVFGASNQLVQSVEAAMEGDEGPGIRPLADAAGRAGSALDDLVRQQSGGLAQPLTWSSETYINEARQYPTTTSDIDWSEYLPGGSTARDAGAVQAVARFVRYASQLMKETKQSGNMGLGFGSISVAAAPANSELEVSFPWFVRSRYLVRSALSDKGPADVMMMQEDDTALNLHHVLHMLRRTNVRWLGRDLAVRLADSAVRAGEALPKRLPEMMLPVPVLIEDGLVGERCLYNRTSWLREALGAPPTVSADCVDLGPPDPASPEAMMPGLTLRLANGWPVYRIDHSSVEKTRGSGEVQHVCAPYNMHFAGTMLPGRLLAHLAESTQCLDPVIPVLPHWQYPPIDRAQDQPYTICGFTAVFDLPPRGAARGSPQWMKWARSSTMWHRPNKYVPRDVGLQRSDSERVVAAQILADWGAAGQDKVAQGALPGPRARRAPGKLLSPLPSGYFEFGPSIGELVELLGELRQQTSP